MQQHPIPQNISTYSFRLIGDMTLKQFLLVLAGVALAVFTYTTNLPGFIKWTFITFEVFFGVGLAFFNIDGRPLEQWAKAYITAIYSPTQFIWRKNPPIPGFFSYTPSPNTLPAQTQEMINAAIKRKQAGLSSFLQTLPEYQLNQRLDQLEASHVTQISKLFATNITQYTPQVMTAPKNQSNPTASFVPQANRVNINAIPQTQNQNPISSSPSLQSSPKSKFTPKKSGVVRQAEVRIINNQKTPASKLNNMNSPIQGEIKLPQSSSTPQPTQNQNTPKLTTKPNTSKPATTAITDANLPFPKTPSTPNTTAGMVLSKEGKIIENAIIEIRDSKNTPVRATKTNKLGQFFSTTPLADGTYELEVEKEGFAFDIIKLELNGQIIQPLKIQAK